MCRVLWIVSVLFLSFASCKARQDQTVVKSEEDLDGDPRWVSSEGKWAIRCKDGRLHNGYKSALVATRELARACEENDLDMGGGGGGSGGGGGGNPPDAREISLQTCSDLDARVAQLNIALSPELQEEIRHLQPPSLAQQRLCRGIGGQMANLVAEDETFELFRDGGETGVPIILLVGPVGTTVEFNQYDPSLKLPWQINNDVVAQINEAIASTNTDILCGSAGRYVLNHCWYLGEGGLSCAQTCETYGMVNTTNTAQVIGAPGSSHACAQVCQSFGFTGVQATSGGYGTGLGCFLSSVGNCHRSDQFGNANDSASPGYRRLCNCAQPR